jgi:hypothetical protein
MYVEGVTLVLPSCFSCLTNIRENISYKLEYQLCETRSIRTSTSITLKEKRTSFLSPLAQNFKILLFILNLIQILLVFRYLRHVFVKPQVSMGKNGKDFIESFKVFEANQQDYNRIVKNCAQKY